jgi:hypothetical protein
MLRPKRYTGNGSRRSRRVSNAFAPKGIGQPLVGVLAEAMIVAAIGADVLPAGSPPSISPSSTTASNAPESMRCCSAER